MHESNNSPQISKFAVYLKPIKLPVRKAIPLPILSLHTDVQSSCDRSKLTTLIQNRIKYHTKMHNMLRIIQAPQPISNNMTKISSQQKLSIEKSTRKRAKTHMQAESYNMSQTFFKQEIQKALKKLTVDKQDTDDECFLTKDKNRLTRSFLRLTVKETAKRKKSLRNQTSKQNNFVKWSSFCQAIPYNVLNKPNQSSKQKLIKRKYLKGNSQVRTSVNGRIRDIGGQQVAGWNSELRYQTVQDQRQYDSIEY